MNIVNNLDARFNQLHWRKKRADEIAWQKSRGITKGNNYLGLERSPLDSAELGELLTITSMLQLLRLCALCRQSGEQESMLRFGDHWIHVDCGAEHHDACMVDPTTRHIEEGDVEYRARMDREFPDFPD